MNYHCMLCGALLFPQEIDGRVRGKCPSCGWVHYRQLKIGAGALIIRDNRLLLLRRNQEPFAGKWNLPAGYVEFDEPPSIAAQREVFEETGLQVHSTDLAGVYYFNDDPRGNGIMLIYRCDLLQGELDVIDENSEGKYFSAAEIPDALAGGGHDQAISAWRNQNLR